MDDNNKNPLEMPDNNPDRETKPIVSERERKNESRKRRMNAVKIVYAFAILIAFGGALTAKIVTEKTLGNINTPIEQDFVTLPSVKESTTDSEVRQNVTNVPDTREETKINEEKPAPATESVTEASPFAEPYKDYYTLPVGTDILREYLPRTPVYNATMNYWKTHPAVDFGAADGSQVKSIAYGTVISIYEDSLLGTVIEIDHGNEVVAKYCGFNKDTLQVKKGDTVKNGQLLGYLGTVPFESSDVSHLHFEITYKGENVDPIELMGKG